MVTAPRAEPGLRRPTVAGSDGGPDAESTRARRPDRTGFVERDGVRVHYEAFGAGEPAILFVPTWSLVHSRVWKAQIPDFARRHRVVTFDARGNGRSDRPTDAGAYAESEMADDLIAVMDAADVRRAVLVSLSLGAQRSLIATALHPARVLGLVFIAPAVPLGERLATRDAGYAADFDDVHESDEGWYRYNRHFWLRDYPAFLEFFFERGFTEPHSTKQVEDAIRWGSETSPEILILTNVAKEIDRRATLDACTRVRCPTLVIQGAEDSISGPGRGRGLAEAIPGARLEWVAGGGHFPNARDPVRVNLLIRDFVAGLVATS